MICHLCFLRSSFSESSIRLFIYFRYLSLKRESLNISTSVGLRESVILKINIIVQKPVKYINQRYVALCYCLVKPVFLKKVFVFRVPEIRQVGMEDKDKITFVHYFLLNILFKSSSEKKIRVGLP